MTETPWWREAVIYQIYIRSFADGNGDGVGDIAGIRSRLPYLAELGVDAIWITPWYPSPMADGGYDVADYRGIAPEFGTLGEAERMIGDAHELGIRVILDIVPNHSSDQHPWFQAALAHRDAPERQRYWFRPGRGPHGELPPNDWTSVFGGPAWTRVYEDGVPGAWYLHLFAPGQPDLNWTNPEVEAAFEAILTHWFDRGVDGFRIDVAHGLVKDPRLPDLGTEREDLLAEPDRADHPHWDRDGVHDLYRAWRALGDSYAGTREGPRAFVAEAWVQTDPSRLARYVRPDELHQAFNFDFLTCPWDGSELRRVIDANLEALQAVGAPATWVMSNHDVIRNLTRYGRVAGHETDPAGTVPTDLELGTRRARAAALLMLALPGGAYVYQGEELGLPEVEDLPVEALRDPVWEQSGHTRRGRDGCRVPLPWSGEAPPYGFGPGGSWLPQPAGWKGRTVEDQADDPSSMLELYRQALQIRRDHAALGDGALRWVDHAGPEVLAFDRDPGFRCVVNLGDEAASLPSDLSPAAEVVLASGPLDGDAVPPDTAVWLRRHDAGS